jgi:hypothetical protein
VDFSDRAINQADTNDSASEPIDEFAWTNTGIARSDYIDANKVFIPMPLPLFESTSAPLLGGMTPGGGWTAGAYQGYGQATSVNTAGGPDWGNDTYNKMKPGTGNFGEDDVYVTVYTHDKHDRDLDSGTGALLGNRNNLLRPGSIALSEGMVKLMKSKGMEMKPGTAIYYKGEHVGYWDDTAGSHEMKPKFDIFVANSAAYNPVSGHVDINEFTTAPNAKRKDIHITRNDTALRNKAKDAYAHGQDIAGWNGAPNGAAPEAAAPSSTPGVPAPVVAGASSAPGAPSSNTQVAGTMVRSGSVGELPYDTTCTLAATKGNFVAAKKQGLRQNLFGCTVYGRFDINPCDVIELEVETSDITPGEESATTFKDELLSGKFLVAGVTHTFSSGNHTTKLNLFKLS